MKSFEEFKQLAHGPTGTAAGEIVSAFERWRTTKTAEGKAKTNAELLGELGIPAAPTDPAMMAFLIVQARAVREAIPQISPMALKSIEETGKAMLFAAWLADRMDKLGFDKGIGPIENCTG
jgi:hypothetical protein